MAARLSTFLKAVRAALWIDAGHPALIRAQSRAFARQLPLLYAILSVNTLLLGWAFLGRASFLLTVAAPTAFGLVCAVRARRWWRLRRADFADVDAAAADLRRAVWVCLGLGLVCSAWALQLSQTGDDLGRAHVAFYMAITVAGCVFCLMNLPAAALALTVAVMFPFAIAFMPGSWHLRLMVVNGFIVFGALLAVVWVSYRSFLQLVSTREELEAGQRRQARLHEENLQLAKRDHLTGLPNRHRFFSALEAHLAEASRRPLAVALVDLDGFKPVNDVFGHAAGDEVLVQAAQRLSQVAAGRLVARMGGDEFAVILTDVGEDGGQLWGERACAALSAPYRVDGVVTHLSGTLGLSGSSDPTANARLLVERADYALYAAKRRAPGTCLRFSAEHDGEVRRTATIRQGLQAETLDDELAVLFQPIVDAHSGEPIALEALARWTHPALGPVPPSEFIAVSENAGLMASLSPRLLRRTLDDMALGPAHLSVSFNLSTHDLMSETALKGLLDLVEAYGVAPGRLHFEVTETVLMSDFGRGRRALEQLRGRGFGVSLDDFGVGHSSLSYVHRLAFDTVKIDRSFIADLETDPVAAGVTKTVIDMCRNLGRACVVEGVETPAQMLRLRQLGARYMQGYLFSRPRPMAQLVGEFFEVGRRDRLEASSERLEPSSGAISTSPVGATPRPVSGTGVS